jgi:hypothetical protein
VGKLKAVLHLPLSQNNCLLKFQEKENLRIEMKKYKRYLAIFKEQALVTVCNRENGQSIQALADP